MRTKILSLTVLFFSLTTNTASIKIGTMYIINKNIPCLLLQGQQVKIIKQAEQTLEKQFLKLLHTFSLNNKAHQLKTKQAFNYLSMCEIASKHDKVEIHFYPAYSPEEENLIEKDSLLELNSIIIGKLKKIKNALQTNFYYAQLTKNKNKITFNDNIVFVHESWIEKNCALEPQ